MFILLPLLFATITLSHQQHQDPYELAIDLANAYNQATNLENIQDLFTEPYTSTFCNGSIYELKHADMAEDYENTPPEELPEVTSLRILKAKFVKEGKLVYSTQDDSDNGGSYEFVAKADENGKYFLESEKCIE